jgi:putative heme iron utilization protein
MNTPTPHNLQNKLKMQAKFVNKKGSKMNRVYLGKDDVDGTMWVYFWLM